VITERATTFERYFTLDLPNTNRFYEKKTASKLIPSLH